jgi:hypothetical protein
MSNENIIGFEGKSDEKTGFYELNQLTVKVRNILLRGDSDRRLNDPKVIHEVNEEVRMIKEKILNLIEALPSGRIDTLPSSEEFAQLASNLLSLPLTVGSGRASITYYDIETSINEVVDVYKKMRNDIKKPILGNYNIWMVKVAPWRDLFYP